MYVILFLFLLVFLVNRPVLCSRGSGTPRTAKVMPFAYFKLALTLRWGIGTYSNRDKGGELRSVLDH